MTGLSPVALASSLPGEMSCRLKCPSVLECQSTTEAVASTFLASFSPNTLKESDALAPPQRGRLE